MNVNDVQNMALVGNILLSQLNNNSIWILIDAVPSPFGEISEMPFDY